MLEMSLSAMQQAAWLRSGILALAGVTTDWDLPCSVPTADTLISFC